jgi:ectoine hydroxylase-related dioxygenase (phytanoyl-CoA dioxygenase family)
MLAIRVHLDDCPAANGALRVMPGSHARKRSREEIIARKTTHREFVCEVPCGGVLAMRPLLLHASAPSESPAHRRVVHLEYAGSELPGGLRWRWRVGGKRFTGSFGYSDPTS